jgi:hypothetical protein
MLILLHDHLNPDQEVFIDPTDIFTIVPLGSGSSINGTVGVHETPSEVVKAIQNATSS